MSPQLPSHIKHLCIEGVIGSGKTSLTNALSKKLNCHALLENFDSNPFLDKFYQDAKAYAFQTQIVFLLSRHRQLKESLNQQNLFYPQIISDYFWEKDKIFAQVTLSEEEIQLYHNIARLLSNDVPKPDYVIYLQASPQTLIERIQLRNRHFEQTITIDYLNALCEQYNSFFSYYNSSPLLIINVDDIDFVHHQKDFDLLLETICKAPQGINYFSSAGA